MSILGIDLGTTNTVAAFDGQVIELSHGARKSPLLPSVVAYLPTGATIVGVPARRRRIIDPKNTIYSAKRLIGRRWHSWDTNTFRALYPFDLVETPEGDAAFNTRRGVVTPVTVGAQVLQTLLQRGADGAERTSVVITVPSLFEENQRQRTLDAAKEAGLEQVTVVDEPVAAIHAYRNAGHAGLGLVTVYDLGGGTFDLAVVDCSGPELRVLGHKGDLYLGGDDIDQALARWAASEMIRRFRWDVGNDLVVFDRLVAECEAAKIRLSDAEETQIDLARVDPAAPESVTGITIGRDDLARVARELTRRTFSLCDEVLSDVGVTTDAIDTVVLAGGTSQLPMVRDGVAAYFGKEPLCEFHPMQVVSIGASVFES